MADLLTPIKVKGNGIAGTPDTNVVTVQGIASGTNIGVTATGNVASGAADSGNPVKIGGVYNSSAPTLTTGQRGDLQLDVNGNLKIAGSITASNPSVGTDGSAIPTSSTLIGASDGTNLQQLLVESSTNRNLRTAIYNGGTEAAVKAASTAAVAADPALVVAVSPNNSVAVTGTFWQATQPVSIAGNQAINVVQIGGATQSATNPLFVELTNGSTAISGTNPLPVQIQASTGTVVDSGKLTSASLAAGSSVTVAGADITASKTGKLREATFSSSVPLKVILQVYNGSTATDKRVFFTESMGSIIYQPVDDDCITQAGGTGDHFQFNITNMDNTNAADVYASLTWTEN